MALPAVPVAGGRGGLKYGVVDTTGTIFTTDRDYAVTEIRFWANGSLIAATARIEAEGQSWFDGNSVPIAALCTRGSDPQAATVGFLYIFRPEVPIRFNSTFSIKIVPSTTVTVLLMGYPTPAA